ncbi:Uma2 family endonuclease [Amaricoccus sp.]|uniref:Uma2 family endonuclease n=1 Tax=Amaricoccus sp. TaxID=1872485 RepID=UPI001B53BA48|nr:Uma2 family endonuclease [Amaricoccus sp.]MBP7003287.1 Uma2 family endonuclease [Amaricoccus sp.]
MTGRQQGRIMKQPEPSEFTADEFIAWAIEQPTGRYELENGVVVAMASERAGHAIAKGNAFAALREDIRAQGLPCRVFPDGMAVRIDDRTVYEPDALVRCGPPVPTDTVHVTDPVIVVEVVSPSTGGVDRGVKLAGYFSMPNLRHYLIVDTDKRLVIHHRRDEDGRIAASVLRDGWLALDPPGLTIEIADIFDGL